MGGDGPNLTARWRQLTNTSRRAQGDARIARQGEPSLARPQQEAVRSSGRTTAAWSNRPRDAIARAPGGDDEAGQRFTASPGPARDLRLWPIDAAIAVAVFWDFLQEQKVPRGFPRHAKYMLRMRLDRCALVRSVVEHQHLGSTVTRRQYRNHGQRRVEGNTARYDIVECSTTIHPELVQIYRRTPHGIDQLPTLACVDHHSSTAR